jgi:hypothetical protein
MERGRVGFKERDVADLLTLYGVTDEDERAALLALAREANLPGWWQKYNDIMPAWFQAYVGLEAAASLIRTYKVQFVPDLLQTEDYARAVASMGPDVTSPDVVERRVELRMARQAALQRPGGPRLRAVVDEAALRRPIGGASLLRAQLAALIEAVERPNITLQVVPFDRSGHVGASGGFTILQFSEPEVPDIVYLEQLTGARYVDKRDEVDQYLEAMDSLGSYAASPEESAELVARIMRER